MRVSDILRIPGESTPQIPHSLLCTIAEHHQVPDEVEGVTYRRLVHREGDQNGKYGREVGVLCVGGKEAALCLCRGKWGDTWDLVVLDQEAYLSLYVTLLRASRRFAAKPPDHDVWDLLYLDDVALLLDAGLEDTRPVPTRADSVAHLHHLIHLAGMREGVEVAVVEAQGAPGEALAHPEDLVRRVVAGLENVRVEPYENEHLGRCVRLAVTR